MGLIPKPDGRLTLDTNGFHVLLEACGEGSEQNAAKQKLHLLHQGYCL